MRQGKFAVVLSVLGALILVVAACAPAATPTPTATPTPPPVVATPTPGVATPTPTPVVVIGATPVAEAVPTLEALEAQVVIPSPAQYGGIAYVFSAQGTPPSFDAQRSYSWTTNQFTGPIFNSLVRYHASAELYLPQWIEPDLAERWEASADGLVYTFYLRKGVKFHDGAPFTAKDVKHSLEKLADPKQSYFAVEFSVIDRVEIVDDYTVKVYLKYSSGLFLPYLAQGMSVMRPEHLKAVSYRTMAIGTGPFKFKSMTSGVDVVYEKNPDYFRRGRPYLDGIVQPILSEPAVLNAFIGGRLDNIGPSRSVENYATIRMLAPEVKLYINRSFTSMRAMFFNLAKEGPWQDVRVRKAMAMVVDYEGSVEAGMGGKEMGEPHPGYFVSAPLGIGLPYSEYEKAWWLGRPLEVRVAEAKRLLALAGYPDGFKGGILSRSSQSFYERVVLLAQDLWKRYLNIELAYEAAESATSLERVARGTFDIAYFPSVSTIADPEQILATTFMPDGASNYGKYSHPKVTELYDQLKREPRQERRVALIHRIERLLIDDVPIVFVVKANMQYGYWPYLKNSVPTNPFGSLLYNKPEIMWLDKADPTWAKRGVGR